MKETQQSEIIGDAIEPLPAPQGIGMAVAFDWGLAVQILATPITVILTGLPAEAKFPGLNPTLNNILLFVLAVPAATVMIAYGEMVRRGRNWARQIQIVANALLSIVGIIQLVSLYQSIKSGNFWPIVTEVILVIFSPLIFWRLTRPSTARWFKHVTVAEARKRHSGSWGWWIAAWAIVGGVLQAIAAIK